MDLRERASGRLCRGRMAEQEFTLHGLAEGLLSDIDAVRAALSLPWSNGPAEGQINRLKLLKRQMYGRAKFDLLRSRVPHAA
jgi:transposase